MNNHTTNNEVVEEWRAIPGWEGSYEASNTGLVRSLDRIIVRKNGQEVFQKGKVLALCTAGPREYLAVYLNRGGKNHICYIHRAVLSAFEGEAPEGMECRHLNGDKYDNRLENLAWGTPSQNIYDQIDHGTHRNARKTHCIRGHEFNEANTRIDKMGRRVCRACQRIHDANRPPRKRAQKRTSVKRNDAA